MVSVLLVQPRHGEAVAAAEYRDFLQSTGLSPDELECRPIDSTSASLGALDGYDGVIVGGSPLNATADSYDEWQRHVHRLLVDIAEHQVPSIYVCYGTTFLTSHYGGEIGHTHAEQSGSTTVELTDAGREDILTRDLPDTFMSFTGHTENVITTAPGHTVLATGPTCPVQLLRVNESTWAAQFHADMDAAALKARMDFYASYGYFDPDVYDSIIASLPDVDAMYANRVLRNFVEICRGERT